MRYPGPLGFCPVVLNASTGLIEVDAGAGGVRQITGDLVNADTLFVPDNAHLLFDADSNNTTTLALLWRTATMSYDVAGNLLSKTTGQASDPSLAHVVVTAYGYDALNRATAEIDAVGTAVQTTSTMAYDSANHLIAKTTGLAANPVYAHPVTTSYAYDGLGRVIQESVSGGGLQQVTFLSYDAAGNLVGRSGGNQSSPTNYGYDVLNRCTLVVTGAGTSVQATSTLAYDAADNVLSRTTGQAVSASQVVTTAYGYDALNRLTVQVDAAGTAVQTTTLAYDAANNLVSRTTGQSANPAYAHVATTLFGYDALHRLTLEVQAAGTDAARTTSLAYDAAGNLTATTVALATTQYQYDALNRLIQETRAAGTSAAQSTSMLYDAADNLLSRTAGPATTLFQYDALNRLTQQIDAAGTGLARTAEP